MSKQAAVPLYRVAFALLTLVAISIQYDTARNNDDFNPVSFFSYFTIQSNILGALVLLYGVGRGSRTRPSQAWDFLRGAAVLYLTMTGVVYGVLLAGYHDALQGGAIPWVNTVLHRVMPLVMLIDWFVDPAHTRLELRNAWKWLVYPLAFLAYSLIRGPIVDWYPYPFLNPDEAGGYAGVALYSLGITLGVLAFIGLLVWASRHVRLTAIPAA